MFYDNEGLNRKVHLNEFDGSQTLEPNSGFCTVTQLGVLVLIRTYKGYPPALSSSSPNTVHRYQSTWVGEALRSKMPRLSKVETGIELGSISAAHLSGLRLVIDLRIPFRKRSVPSLVIKPFRIDDAISALV